MINDNTAQWRIKKVGAFPTPNMQGATASEDGKAGTVPSPKIADRSKVLRGDGTWGNAPLAEALSDTLPIANGGTGAITAEEACANIGALKASEVSNSANKVPRYNLSGHLVLPDGSEFWIG